MKPIIKWTGGKRRELKHITKMLPNIIERYVEPFVGGGALYFYLEHKNSIINDFDFELINFYKMVGDKQFIDEVAKLSLLNNNHDAMSEKYYELRALDRKDINKYSDVIRAIRFFYINQLAFSGMRRFNSNGQFNVPFGHYKKLSNQITKAHLDLLKITDIKNGDAIDIINDEDNKNTFIFLDPPYTRIFKTYSHDNVFDMGCQQRLCNSLKRLQNAKFMLVINKDDNILNMYKEFNIIEYDIKYGVNIKNRFSTNTSHTIITNY